MKDLSVKHCCSMIVQPAVQEALLTATHTYKRLATYTLTATRIHMYTPTHVRIHIHSHACTCTHMITHTLRDGIGLFFGLGWDPTCLISTIHHYNIIIEIWTPDPNTCLLFSWIFFGAQFYFQMREIQNVKPFFSYYEHTFDSIRNSYVLGLVKGWALLGPGFEICGMPRLKSLL